MNAMKKYQMYIGGILMNWLEKCNRSYVNSFEKENGLFELAASISESLHGQARSRRICWI